MSEASSREPLGPSIRHDVEKIVNQLLDVGVRIEMARVYAFERNADKAQEAIGRARKIAGTDRTAWWIGDDGTILDARIDMLRGNDRRAVGRLAKPLLEAETLDSAEGFALLAVAAHRSGQEEIAHHARVEAERRGVDMSALDEPVK